ncbi:hypothetical protein ACIPUC_33640 [Streptomyces sp. LARHCF249]
MNPPHAERTARRSPWRHVTGDIRMTLHGGRAGFIEIFGLSSKIAARRDLA